MSPVSDSSCPEKDPRGYPHFVPKRPRWRRSCGENAPNALHRGLGRIALVAQSQATYRVEKTFSVLARAIGIDVDVFREIEAAEAWLEDNNESSGAGERPLPH